MKRFLLASLALLLAYMGFAQNNCRYQEYQQQQLTANPGLAAIYDKIEQFTRTAQTNIIAGNGNNAAPLPVPDNITIPVVVHILYNQASQNIAEERILAQLESLNKDFEASTADMAKLPVYFRPFVANVGIKFQLAKVDPKGFATSGIVRKYTGIQNFLYDDRVKNSSRGGDDAWDSDKYLNIWVCNTVSGLLGYSSIPGGAKEIDGVVINTGVFGLGTGTNKGRTLVHEIGHWLNLRHIWGDGYCGDDYVDDTPKQQMANRGCPSGEKKTCGSTAHGDMYMNFMDFTDDACMYMFTFGQRQRMRNQFEIGGPRHALLYSTAITALPLPAPIPVPEEVPMQVSLYPNPTVSTVILQTTGGQNLLGKTAKLFTQTGQLVQSFIIQSNRQSIIVSNLKNGVYFLAIENAGLTTPLRFVKQ